MRFLSLSKRFQSLNVSCSARNIKVFGQPFSPVKKVYSPAGGSIQWSIHRRPADAPPGGSVCAMRNAHIRIIQTGRGRQMRYFFVDPTQVAGSKAVLEGSEASHVKNVLRLKRGDEVGLVDGSGFEYVAQIDRVVPGRVELSISDRRRSPGVAPVRIHAAQGCLKEKKMDRIVRQLSELGVARWTPFICRRTVTRLEPGRAAYRAERWRKIAIGALKQSRRGNLMEIGEVTAFEHLLELRPAHDLGIIFWEGAERALSARREFPAASAPNSILVVLGPEGGFSAEEAGAAMAAGFVAATLGPRILRAETAVVAACSIVQYLFGDFGEQAKKS
jgi:16S rRNA (uracil1498-N3)-methyltransferase